MTRAIHWKNTVKIPLVVLGSALLVVTSLVLLAVVAWSARIIIAMLIPAGLAALALSPALRRWVSSDAREGAQVKGLVVPFDVMLHPQHAWARIEDDDSVAVGADDLLQKALGPVDAVDLPRCGTHVKQGDVLFTLHSGVRNVAVKAPISGFVRRLNIVLERNPERVNASPYGTGWAMVLKPSNLAAQRRGLRRQRGALDWFRTEVDRLIAAASPGELATATMQDGGAIHENLHGELDDATWNEIRHSFFDEA